MQTINRYDLSLQTATFLGGIALVIRAKPKP
jgi:hypothetical protein